METGIVGGEYSAHLSFVELCFGVVGGRGAAHGEFALAQWLPFAELMLIPAWREG